MSVQGLDRLHRKLTRTIPERVLARVREAMEQAAEEAVDVIRSLAPEDSGALKDSIGWTWGDAPKGSIALLTSKRTAGGMRITIYAGGGDAFYARFVEFGTSPHVNKGKFAGTQNPGMAAQPFFFPGWRMVRRKAKRRMTGAIRKAIKEGAR
ncbi:HK97-gp10 family putative phage morphogenesis protein [Ciceribacter thiooxidans]|uniref:HK97-gp10 family putative phage morphogenesis protein n=1 Tax=Ciceribacter thiooxidans TaxID=1969821 RepID=A0ABV7I080_9HYPH|nr:HK97-gp10 family putative phage morphogenesis protein [Ciceribacter thiooxidans]